MKEKKIKQLAAIISQIMNERHLQDQKSLIIYCIWAKTS